MYVCMYVYIVTVLGTLCIQTYSCPEVSYAISICVHRTLLVCRGEQKGVRCDVFLVRLINLYIPSITIHGTIALAALGSLATTHHCPSAVSGGSFRGRIFMSAVPFRLPQAFQFNLGCTTVHLPQTRVEWAGFPGLAEIPARKGGPHEGPVQSEQTVTSASPRPLPDLGDL